MNLLQKFIYKHLTKKADGLRKGWYQLEEDDHYFRWTKKEASFVIKERVTNISFLLSSGEIDVLGEIIVNDIKRRFKIKKNSSKRIILKVDNKLVDGKIRVDKLFKSPKGRSLGVKVKRIAYFTKKSSKDLDLRKLVNDDKKNIVVVTSQVPFEKGGNEFLAESLVNELNKRGYNACVFYTPQNRHYKFKELIKGYLSNRLTDLREYNGKKIDQIISLKFPSFAVKHPNHVCWFNHRQREYYDLWNDWIVHEKINGRGLKRKIERKIIHFIDSRLLKYNVSKLYSQSKNIQKRLNKWGGVKSEVLYAPPVKDSKLYCEAYDSYIFTISRLSEIKRIDLLVNAFKYVKNKSVKCLIAGEGEEKERLKKLIKKNKLEKRIKLLGFISDDEAVKHLANCRGVFFGPFQEDYGLVTLEAMKSKKCVITCTDSGGPTEFIKNGKTGFKVEPSPKKIAEKIDFLASNKKKAKKMGETAYQSVNHINWDNTIKKLVII